jgi:hypothetical protein
VQRVLTARRSGLLALLGGVLSLIWGSEHSWVLVVGAILLVIGIGIQLVTVGMAVWRGRNGVWVRFSTAAMLSLGVCCWYLANQRRLPMLLAAGAVALLATLWLTRRVPLALSKQLQARHLPGAPEGAPERPRLGYSTAVAGLCGVWVLGFVAGAVRLPSWVFLALSVAGAAAMAAVALVQRPLVQHSQQVSKALRDLNPVYAMPYNGRAGFHIGLWSPYLERTGKPVIVVTTEEYAFNRVGGMYPSLPVIFAPGGDQSAVRALFPPSVLAAFYVHNGKNAGFVKVRGVTHVFVHHGDSDKMTSAMPRMAQYDVIVAAGQAAVDRYAKRGIALPSSKFKILGRPQTEGILTVTRPISAIAQPVVLYAPTWHGIRDELDYCSLPVGVEIVTGLLDRGATVVFRPHPADRGSPAHAEPIAAINALLAANAKATGRKHRWGKTADAPTIAELTNQVDAMVADVSGVVTDFLQSLKPFAMVAMGMDTEQFRREFPSSQAAYVIEGDDLSTLNPALDGMLGDDLLASTRADRRRYYLGGYDDGESAKAFVSYAESLAQADPEPVSAPVSGSATEELGRDLSDARIREPQR